MEKKGITVYLLGVLFLISISSFPICAATPQEINYQGYLTDSDGNTVQDGYYSMTFSIYNVQESGIPVWSDSQAVEVINGVYNVTLGKTGNLLDPSIFDGDLYLGVTVESGPEMAPRQKLTSTPFAMKSAIADNADTVDGEHSSAFASKSHAHPASAISSGTLSPDRFSAYDDLDGEGYLDNDYGDLAQNNGTLQIYLNADFLDGKQGSYFAEHNHTHDGSAITSGTMVDERIPASISRDSEVMPIVKANDGAGSGLNADLLDGEHASAFASSSHYHFSLDASDGTPADALYVDSSGDVGIGLPHPSEKLHVFENRSGLTFPFKVENYSLSGDAGILFSVGGDGGRISTNRGKGALIYEQTSTWNRGKFHFLQNTETNTDLPDFKDVTMTIENNGNVGIGTRTPMAKLEVNDVLRVTGSTWPTTGEGLELAYSSTLNKGYVQAYDRTSQTWSDLYLGNGRVGIGDAYPENQLHVEGTGSSVGGTTGFDEVVARFKKTGSGHSAASIDSASGQDSILFLAENGQAYWDVRHDSDASHSLNIRYHGGSAQNTSILRILPDGITRVQVLEIVGGSDLAEPFHVNGHEKARPGMVVSIDPNFQGQLRLSTEAYDRKVAGIISGAKDLKPGMVMKAENNEIVNGDHPVALTGRVWCWCDAHHGTITPGDLLTTSDTAGHAMKVQDHSRAQGAILGKAMSSLEAGRGMVLVLVTLQ